MKMTKKHEYFKKVSQARKKRVLEALQALGNCSNPATYAYEVEELSPIFQEIAEKLAEVWQLMSIHSPYSFVPFRLKRKTVMEIGGKKCRRDRLAAMSEVLELLRAEGADFVALESVRKQYSAQFGSELCWSYPFCDGKHLGGVILPVQEGVLYLPYSALDCETYEQFCIEDAGLLTVEKVQFLMKELLSHGVELFAVLSNACWEAPEQSLSSDYTEQEGEPLAEGKDDCGSSACGEPPQQER